MRNDDTIIFAVHHGIHTKYWKREGKEIKKIDPIVL